MNKAFLQTFLDLEIAETQEQRRKGFQGRQQLSEYEAKLFKFPEKGKHSMWMKDTPVALDIIFLDERGEVINIEQGTPNDDTHIFSDSNNCKYVLELKQGKASDLKIEAGTDLSFLL